jgi:hypothetical protein
VTPDDFEGKFNTLWGSGFSIAPLFRQSAWFRFHNRSEDLENLYFCGAGTHPGAGVPGVVSSAKVVEKLVPPFPSCKRIEISGNFSFQEPYIFTGCLSFAEGKSRSHL